MGKRAAKIIDTPLMGDLMTKVTPRNKKHLEALYGIRISDDVSFVVTPDVMAEPGFMEDHSDCNPNRERKPGESEVLID